MTAQAEREPSPAQSREPGAESRPEVPGKASGEARLTSPEDIRGPSDPDYLFHVIFVGDSNVGKTSFLHLLHQNTFAAGLAATVGKNSGEVLWEGRPGAKASELEQAQGQPSLKTWQVGHRPA
jgi:hypothetical protein